MLSVPDDPFKSETAPTIAVGASLSDVINTFNDFSRIYNERILKPENGDFNKNGNDNLPRDAGI